MAKARGFLHSRVGIPASLGVACSSFRPSRSYTSSTGRHREPRGQNVSRGIEIPVMPDAALRADPFTHIKREVFYHMFAVMAHFAGRIPTVNLDEGSSIPLALILQLADKLAPSHIDYCFCQTVILYHILDGQTLHANHLVFVHNSCRKFVLVVSSTVLDTSMHACYFPSCFLPVLGAFLCPGMPMLDFCESLLVFCIVAWVAHSFASGEDHHRFESQVQPNLCIDWHQRFDLFFNQHRDKVAIGTVFGDGDRTGLASFGECSVEGERKRLIHLGKREFTIFPGESIGGIGCRLVAMPLLEGGILGSPLEEILVGTVQMAKGLLNGHRGDIRKPGMLFLQIGQHGREIVIEELFPMLGIGSLAGGKALIVHKATASERLRKDTLLLVSRVEPILVCPLCFAHCFAPFKNMGTLSHTCQYTNIHDRGKENEHCSCGKVFPHAPAPNKESHSIPVSK